MSSTSTETRGPSVVAASAACIAISTIAILLRFWSRFVFKQTGIWWDDWAALGAWVFAMSSCSFSMYWVKIGFGQHLEVVLASGRIASDFLLLIFADDFLYYTGISLVKVSVLFFYARIFNRFRWFRFALWITGGLVVAWWITFTIVAIFSCIPVEKQWKNEVPGHCLDQSAIFVANATPNVLLDAVILVLPMPPLVKLHVGAGRKFAVLGVFATGYCVMIISILRLVTVVRYQSRHGADDLTWNIVEPKLLVVVEVPLGILSICLPSIFQLVKQGIYGGFHSLFSPRLSYPTPQGDVVYKSRVGNSIERCHEGFVKIDEATPARSIQQLFSATSSQASRGPTRYEEDMPLEQIHVRTDVEVQREVGCPV